MDISFIDSGVNDGTGIQSITVTLPTHQTDDFFVAFCNRDAASPGAAWSTDTSGWTLGHNFFSSAGRDHERAFFYKKALSASETDPEFDSNAGQNEAMSASVLVFRGVDTTTPLDVAIVFDSGENEANPTCAPITPVTANGGLVLAGSCTHNDHSAGGVPTTPSGLTLGPVVLGSDKNNRQHFTAYLEDYGSAATITPTAWTHTADPTNEADWGVYSIALRPAGGGGADVRKQHISAYKRTG